MFPPNVIHDLLFDMWWVDISDCFLTCDGFMFQWYLEELNCLEAFSSNVHVCFLICDALIFLTAFWHVMGSYFCSLLQSKLNPDLAKRAGHYFSENLRVKKGFFLPIYTVVVWCTCDYEKHICICVCSTGNATSWLVCTFNLLCHAFLIHSSHNIMNISGLEAWASGNLEDFGSLISASGFSSIQNYDCGTTCFPFVVSNFIFT